MKRAALGIGAGLSLLAACGGVAERAPEQALGAASPSRSAAEPAGSNPVRMAPAFAGANGAGAAGASAACTAVGCMSGFQLKLDKASPWASGSYAFRLLEDGHEAGACNVIVPASRLREEVAVACAGGDVRLDLGDAREASIVSVWLFTAAEQVSLEVVLDSQQLALAEYAPKWAVFRPNGPECEPVCLSATPETLALH